MKLTIKNKLTLITLIAVFYSPIINACDFCNGMMGINPYYNYSDKIMLNILFQHSTLDAIQSNQHDALNKHNFLSGMEGTQKIMHGGNETNNSTENKINFEFAYQHHFNSKFMITSVAPIEKSSSSSEGESTGLGDISILGHFVLRPDFGLEDSPLTFLFGAGIKLPTGNFDRKHSDGDRMEINHQTGSGSVDYILNGSAFYQLKDFTLGTDLYGKINSKNKYDEKLGNWFSASGTISYDVYRNDEEMIGLVAIGGLRYEFKGENSTDNQTSDKISDFASVFGNVGVQLIYEEIRLNVSVLIPFSQNRSETLPTEHTRYLIGTRWEF